MTNSDTSVFHDYRPEDSGRFPVDFSSPFSDANPPEQPKHHPQHSPAAHWVVMCVGVLFLGLAGVIIRDLLVNNDTVSGKEWLPEFYHWLADFSIRDSALVVAIVSGIIALILLIWVCKPRKTVLIPMSPAGEHSADLVASSEDVEVAVTGYRSTMWMRPVDIARLSTYAVQRVQGVANAHSVASKRKLVVNVRPILQSDAEDNTDLKERIKQALDAQFDGLGPTDNVDIRIAKVPQPSVKED